MMRRDWFNRLKGVVISLALTLGLFFPGLVSAAGDAIVSVSAPGQAVSSGDTFTVTIAVEPNNDIAGMQFDLSFDPSLVTVDSVEEGNLLSQDGASIYFEAGTVDNVAGTISGVYGAIISPGQTVSGAGTFATITLTAGAEGGVCPLTLSNVVVGDIDGQSVPVSVVDGEVTINRPPVLSAIGNKSVDEGELLEFTILATDPDGGSLTYSASNLPDGAIFDPETRTFSWTPLYNQAEVYAAIHFEVSDGSLTDSEDITITVNQAYEDWDTNSDGAVNVLDIIMVGQHWGEMGPIAWIQEDVNEDGTINVLDIILIGQHWTA
jgi:hypothetical protein